MSDTNFMNAYVNLVVETVHSYLNEILQLKTQLSVINGLVSERDQVIANLEQELTTLREEKQRHQGDESEMQKLRDNAATWEFQYNTMVNKVSHMDALTNQYNELKKQFVEKTQIIERLEINIVDYEMVKKELESVRQKLEKCLKKEEKKSSVEPPKKDINKDSKPLTMAPKVTKIETKVESKKTIEETDDF